MKKISARCKACHIRYTIKFSGVVKMFPQISPSYSVDPITNVYLLALSSDDSNIAEKFGDLENFVMRNVQYVKKTYLKKLILIPKSSLPGGYNEFRWVGHFVSAVASNSHLTAMDYLCDRIFFQITGTIKNPTPLTIQASEIINY